MSCNAAVLNFMKMLYIMLAALLPECCFPHAALLF
jgi:hypothetical protein